MTKRWSAHDLPDMTGKRILVTGANGGLGWATCRALAGAGADVVLACRSLDKGRAAADAIQQEYPKASLEVMELDLASLASIRQLADEFRSRQDRLDVLINNAGIIGQPKTRTEDGFELQVGVDFLGHFALTGLLLDSLRNSAAARVIAVGSSGLMHRFARIRLNDLNWQRGRYDKLRATGQAKLALQMFSFDLQTRLAANHEAVISVAAHPGVADTDVSLTGYEVTGARLRKRMLQAFNAAFAQPAEQGALPTLYAAAAPGVKGGDSYGPSGLLELRGYPVPVSAAANARNPEVAAKLWSLAEGLTGVQYLS